jgi:hypothetical protein
MTRVRPFLHDDPVDRPPDLTASTQTLWHGPGRSRTFCYRSSPAADGTGGEATKQQ